MTPPPSGGQARTRTRHPVHGTTSETTTTTIDPDSFAQNGTAPVRLVLRGVEHAPPSAHRGRPADRRVVWTEDTVDNEGLGRKKSKSMCLRSAHLIFALGCLLLPGWLALARVRVWTPVLTILPPPLLPIWTPCAVCCIYHKPREFDESSSESSDSDSPESDSDLDSESDSSSSSAGAASDARRRLKGKGKARADQGHKQNGQQVNGHACTDHDHDHLHHHSSSHSRKQQKERRKKTERRTGGSSTMTITQTTEGAHTQEAKEDGGKAKHEDKRARKPNRYEQGYS